MACPTASGMHLPSQLIQWRCISSRWKTGVSTYLRTWDDIILRHSNTNTLTFEPLMSKCQYQLQFNVWSSGPKRMPDNWVPRLWMPFVPSRMASWTACALVVIIPKFQHIFVTGHCLFIVLNHLSSFGQYFAIISRSPFFVEAIFAQCSFGARKSQSAKSLQAQLPLDGFLDLAFWELGSG